MGVEKISSEKILVLIFTLSPSRVFVTENVVIDFSPPLLRNIPYIWNGKGILI